MPCTLIRGRNTDRKGSSSGWPGPRPAIAEAVKGPSTDLPYLAQDLHRCYNIRTHVRGNSARRSVSWTEESTKLNLQNAKQHIAISPLSGRRTMCLLVLIESGQDRWQKPENAKQSLARDAPADLPTAPLPAGAGSVAVVATTCLPTCPARCVGDLAAPLSLSA